MKKLFLFSMLCLMAFSMKAQRCAVLDFQVGTGVTEEDIEGISFEFRSKFNPHGYTMLERVMVSRTIQKLGYNATNMSSQQMLKVGRSLDASIIVVGTMNKVMDEYSVEIRAIDVSSGRTIVSEGANFERTAYRSSMQKAAQNLANKLSSGQSGSATSNSSSSNISQGFVDLGLPSGTLWKDVNEEGFYTYDQALNFFGDNLPSEEQWQELISFCRWDWTGNGFNVVGRNGKHIFLPAEGRINEGKHERKNCGYYWTSTPANNANVARRLGFSWNEEDLGYGWRWVGRSIRIIHD